MSESPFSTTLPSAFNPSMISPSTVGTTTPTLDLDLDLDLDLNPRTPEPLSYGNDNTSNESGSESETGLELNLESEKGGPLFDKDSHLKFLIAKYIDRVPFNEK